MGNFPRAELHELEFSVYESSDRALSVGVNSNQQPRCVLCLFIMWIWLSLQVCLDAVFSFRRINRFETFRKGTSVCLFAQSQCLFPLQKRLDCPAQVRPILDLTRNRAFRNFTDQSSIENQNIRELYGLTHMSKVAFCHQDATSVVTIQLRRNLLGIPLSGGLTLRA